MNGVTDERGDKLPWIIYEMVQERQRIGHFARVEILQPTFGIEVVAAGPKLEISKCTAFRENEIAAGY